jgi:hypothetical protein
MARSDPHRNTKRVETLADLRAQAAEVFPDDYTPSRKVGLGSVGRYSVAELRRTHIAVHMTAAMRAEAAAEARARFEGADTQWLRANGPHALRMVAEMEREGRI